MRRSGNTISTLASLVVVSVVASILIPPSAGAQQSPGPSAAPTISAPDGCGGWVDEGGDNVTVSGSITPGASVSKAVIQQFAENGDVVPPDVDVTSQVRVTGLNGDQLAGSFPLPQSWAGAASLALIVTAVQSGTEGPAAQSNHLFIDRTQPTIIGAHTTSANTIRVTFSEPVTAPNGDSAVDWYLNGDETVKPGMVTGSEEIRVLRFEGLTFGEDEHAVVHYRNYPGRQPYRDCVNHNLDANRIHTTVDGILPAIPSIDEINSDDATDDRVAGRETQPVVKVGGLSSGHQAELWLETNGTVGLQDSDQKVGDPVTESDGAATIQSPALTPNDEHTFYARAIDINGNVSDGADDALYRLDTLRPTPTSANTNDQIVTVAFDDNLASGRNDPADWTITVAAVTSHPTQVSGTGSTRQLHLTQVPSGALVSYTRPPADGYADEAGNDLDSFDNVLVKALVPTTVDLEPETASAAAGEDHELDATVTDAAGTLVPGATLTLRSISGPSSDRNMDGDQATPVGVISSCRTGGDGMCTFSYTANGAGTDVLQAWLGTGAPPAPEPRDATGADLQNGQDVVEAEWHLEGASLWIDAIPEFSDGQVNAPHVTTVRVFSVGGPTPDSPMSGINVDGRVIQGPNEGLRLGECDTNGDGICTISYTSTGAGTDQLQFWIDADGDNSTTDELFLDRNESAEADTSPGPLEVDDDAQDVTRRSWSGAIVPVLQIEPETSSGQINVARSLTFSTTAQGSASAIAGLNVDARVLSGPNAGAYLGECTTDDLGRCTLANYVSSKTGTDVIQGWIDTNDDDVSNEVGRFEARDESTSADEPDQDVVQATWASGSPSPTASPTGTASPTPSPSPSETTEVGTRGMTMSASASQVAFRAPVTLSGQVETIPGCTSATVEILRRSMSGTNFAGFAVTQADAAGEWTIQFRPKKSAVYEARVAGDETCQAARSDDVAVAVGARVRARINRTWASLGECAVVRGRVAPKKAGQPVQLQKRRTKGWKNVASRKLNTKSRFRFKRCPSKLGRLRFRVIWAGDDQNLSDVSRTLRLRMYR